MKLSQLSTAELAAHGEALVKVASAIGETVKALGSIPAGHLYALLMSKMDLEQFNFFIGLLIEARLVRRDLHHMLTWVGADRTFEAPKQQEGGAA